MSRKEETAYCQQCHILWHIDDETDVIGPYNHQPCPECGSLDRLYVPPMTKEALDRRNADPGWVP